ncbi:hypothetical protein LPJ55_003068 [Coemansia sp. RSA 990]|nr:hypothetical protein LPJ55_003068 [Coemansia sp. RSA 990]
MVSIRRVCYAALALLRASQAQLFTRDVSISDVTQFQSAILMRNGNQTSCESVLVDSKAGFIAASCLQLNNNKVDEADTYNIVVKYGSGGPTASLAISKIDVHPSYNSSTFVNNLAVIQFDDGAEIEWKNYIGINPDEWDNEYFIRHSLANKYTNAWNNIVGFDSMETPNYCEEASLAYSANQGDFLCNYAASLSVYNTTCKVPYGVVYAAVQPSDLSMVAIYSHSAVYGESMCSKDRKLHYYTILRNYIGWAAGVIGRPVGGFAKSASFEFTPTQDYKMKDVSGKGVKGVSLFSGDVYSQNQVDPKMLDKMPEPENESAIPAEPEPSPAEPSPAEPSSAESSSAESSSAESSSAEPSPAESSTTESSTATTPSLFSNAQDTSPDAIASPQEPLPIVELTSDSTSSDSTPETTSESEEPTSESPSESEEPTSESSSESEEPVSESSSEPSSSGPSSSEDPEESGQSIIVDDTETATPTTETPTETDSGNYVDYGVNSDGEVSSSHVEDPNLANQANAPEGGVKTNQMAVIIVLVVGGVALVGAAIAWYVIRRKKQALRRQNNWDARESMKPLPNGMRMTADLVKDINYRGTVDHRQTIANNGWRDTNYQQAYPRNTTNTAWTDNYRATTADILSQYYDTPHYEGNYQR